MDCQSRIKVEKSVLRKKFFYTLNNLSVERTGKAQKLLVQFFQQFLENPITILSFISLPSEINTQLLNKMFVTEHKLFVPSFYKPSYVFRVKSEQSLSLLTSCKDSLSHQKIFYPDIILVPGIAFSTTTKHRLGRGLGWYDIYLSQLPPSSLSIGIGFQEQRYDELPIASHDIPLKKLFLF